jgi:uncharacterized alkaline shock family protein YloU
VSAGDTTRIFNKKLLVEQASDAAIAADGVVAVVDAAAAVGRRGPLGEARVRLKLSVVVQYGVRIPEAAAEVRGRVAAALENQTGCQVTAVDVIVADLYVPGEPGVSVGLGVDAATGARIDF